MVLLIATRLLFALEFLCCTALGQESSELGKLDLSFGYSYVHVSSSSTSDLGTQSLNGADMSVSYQLTPWLRIVADFGLASAGYRMSDIIGISLRSAQSTYLFGPCFVLPMGRTTPSAQVLYGVARANAGMFDTSSTQADFAWHLAVGSTTTSHATSLSGRSSWNSFEPTSSSSSTTNLRKMTFGRRPVSCFISSSIRNSGCRLAWPEGKASKRHISPGLPAPFSRAQGCVCVLLYVTVQLARVKTNSPETKTSCEEM